MIFCCFFHCLHPIESLFWYLTRRFFGMPRENFLIIERLSQEKIPTQKESEKFLCGREYMLFNSNLFSWFCFFLTYDFRVCPLGKCFFFPLAVMCGKNDSLFVVLLCLNYTKVESKSLPNLRETAGCILETGWKQVGLGRGWTLIGGLMCVPDPAAGSASSDTGNESVLWKKIGPLCG